MLTAVSRDYKKMYVKKSNYILMIDKDFCTLLEYEICKTFKNSKNDDLKSFWCDGILIPVSNLSRKYVNDNRQIITKAYIGENGQDNYELIIKFGKKSLSKYARCLDLRECIPNSEKEDWLKINTESKLLELQLE